MLYVSDKLAQEEDQADKVFKDFLRTTLIKEYVQNCLEIQAKNAIRLAALQGGRIYDEQIGKPSKHENLVVYLPFDQNTSLITQDHALQNDGILNDMQWTIQGVFDAAYRFDGYRSFIEVSHDETLALENFTITAWINTNYKEDQTILEKNGSGRYFSLSLNNNQIQCSISNGLRKVTVASATVADGLWHHVACTLTKNQKLTLFIDGNPMDYSNAITVTPIDNAASLLIGKDSEGNYFNGTIDEVAIYNTSLNLKEIRARSYFQPTMTNPLVSNDMVPYRQENNIHHVSYGIKAPVPRIDIFNLDIPLYPYNTSLVIDPVEKYNDSLFFPPIDHYGLFSYHNQDYQVFPKLCNVVGPNYFNYSKATYTCETYSIHNDSVQTMLAQFIANRTKECVNFSYFRQIYRYNVTEGEMTADVLFGEEDLLVLLYYPITVNIAGKPPVTKMISFNFPLDVRFKKVHELAQHIIGHKDWISNYIPTADSNNIFFNFSDDPADCKFVVNKSKTIFPYPCNPGNTFVIALENSYCKDNLYVPQCQDLDAHYQHSHILKIIDNSSIIDGRPLSFLLAVENRIPALDYIDESVNASYFYSNYTDHFYQKKIAQVYNKTAMHPNPKGYNVVVDAGQEIEFFPFGQDPDDENLSFKYSGWKTNMSIFNLSYEHWEYYQDTNHPPAFWRGSHVYGGMPTPMNYWENSDYYKNGFNTSSKLFKDANLQTTAEDVGYHWVRITVTDSEGLSDYQDIKLQVRCPGSHDCCEVGNDYHWKTCNACCDPAEGYPCTFGHCSPHY